MGIPMTTYMLALCALVVCPLLQAIAGGLLVAAGKHLSGLNASRGLITGCRILGATFLLYTIIKAVYNLFLIVPIIWPPM